MVSRLGINGVAAIGGAFIGLILGGLLAPIEWRLVFLVSVPVGLFGTVWSTFKLRDNGVRTKSSIDWTGNVTVRDRTHRDPHRHRLRSPALRRSRDGLDEPVRALVHFRRHRDSRRLRRWSNCSVNEPMFQLHLFQSRSFAMGNLATLMLALARGGLQFMLIIWLQGIWLPEHGYSFSRTPLWAGIYMVPLTIGFFIAGPLAGRLADRHGARNFATLGLVLTGISFIGLQAIPINFSYPVFALLLLLVGLSMGLFAAPNTSAVMNSLPANQRGAGGAMLNTFQNSASVLSIGFFFTIITLGLASSLPHSLFAGLTAQGVPAAQATTISHIPAIGSLFSAFLGINPIQTLLGAHLLAQPGVHASVLLGRGFFPGLIASPFAKGLHAAFLAAAGMCFVGAVFSWMRGGGVRDHALARPRKPKKASPMSVTSPWKKWAPDRWARANKRA